MSNEWLIFNIEKTNLKRWKAPLDWVGLAKFIKETQIFWEKTTFFIIWLSAIIRNHGRYLDFLNLTPTISLLKKDFLKFFSKNLCNQTTFWVLSGYRLAKVRKETQIIWAKATFFIIWLFTFKIFELVATFELNLPVCAASRSNDDDDKANSGARFH